MAEIEGDSAFASGGSFAILCLTSSKRTRQRGAATPAKLRVLRQGSSAELNGSAHLQLRMHVLRGLRREQTAQCVPELRRRFCRAADPPGEGMAAGIVGREAPAIGQAGASVLQSRRYWRALGEASGYPA